MQADHQIQQHLVPIQDQFHLLLAQVFFSFIYSYLLFFVLFLFFLLFLKTDLYRLCLSLYLHEKLPCFISSPPFSLKTSPGLPLSGKLTTYLFSLVAKTFYKLSTFHLHTFWSFPQQSKIIFLGKMYIYVTKCETFFVSFSVIYNAATHSENKNGHTFTFSVSCPIIGNICKYIKLHKQSLFSLLPGSDFSEWALISQNIYIQTLKFRHLNGNFQILSETNNWSDYKTSSFPPISNSLVPLYIIVLPICVFCLVLFGKWGWSGLIFYLLPCILLPSIEFFCYLFPARHWVLKIQQKNSSESLNLMMMMWERVLVCRNPLYIAINHPS